MAPFSFLYAVCKCHLLPSHYWVRFPKQDTIHSLVFTQAGTLCNPCSSLCTWSILYTVHYTEPAAYACCLHQGWWPSIPTTCSGYIQPLLTSNIWSLLTGKRHYPQEGSLVSLPSHTHTCITSLCPAKPIRWQSVPLLQVRHTSVRFEPTMAVKQGCPSSPLLASLGINDVGTIGEGGTGAVTGPEDAHSNTCCRRMTWLH